MDIETAPKKNAGIGHDEPPERMTLRVYMSYPRRLPLSLVRGTREKIPNSF